uniref:Uncharacterized protein n=3 Tax=Sphaeramia orbicularis TaxID=375764 RepID=A0A673C2K7_9TELE
MILPIALQHLCPFYVSLIGMGALAAAVMSSVDSVLLSAASQLARNIYKNIICRQASEKSVLVVVKVSVLLCGVIGACLALTTSSVALFWILSSDVLYSMMTPQVICILYLSQWVNVYGACCGFVFSLLLRGLVGEPMVGLPDVLPLPWDRIQEDGHRYRLFPFRTAIMLLTFVVILLVSQMSIRLKGKKLLTNDAEMNEMHDLGPNQKNVEENEALNKDEEPSYPA